MRSYYDVNYRQKVEATLNKDWSAIDTSLFSQCFTGRAIERCRAVPTAAPSNMNQQNARTRMASIQPMKTSKTFIQSNKNKRPMCASTGITNTLVTPLHAATSMNASSAFHKNTLSWIVQKGYLQEDGPLVASTHKEADSQSPTYMYHSQPYYRFMKYVVVGISTHVGVTLYTLWLVPI